MEESENKEYVIVAVFRHNNTWHKLSTCGTSKKKICDETIRRIQRMLYPDAAEPSDVHLYWGSVKADGERIGSYYICAKK